MRLLLLASSFLCLSTAFNVAYACTCPPLESAAEQAEKFDLIFLGTATGSNNVTPPIERSPDQAPPPPSPELYETSFEVTRVLKGDNMSSVIISHTAPSPMSCGVQYPTNEPLFILASGSKEKGYTTWFCSNAQFSVDAFDAALNTVED